MNSESLYADRDMGKDGNNVVGNCNKYFAKDAFGFSLGYHNSDYTPIDATATFLADKTGSDLQNNTANLYNGNISSMVTTITTPVTFIPEPSFETLAQSNAYTYDRLNRLVESKSFANLDYENNDWMNSGNPYDGRYHNQFTYNANGGMLTALAKNAMGETIDNQTYNRATVGGRYVNNRTYAITDAATQTSGEDLLDQQAFDNVVLSNNNYDFTEIGERNKNLSEDIESITWTVYGKKAGVKRTATSGKNNVTFNYDPQNNRIAKHVYTSDDIWINSEYYVRDAQGNLMATYRLEASSGSGLSYELTERHIYGSNSIGINTTPVEMIGVTPPTDTYPHVIGDKRFNGSNHLNNVLSVFTDKKLPLDIDNNGIIDGYLPQVISANDYAPFGSRLAERTFNKELYPNSFNGKRESAELDGEQDYGERDYNPKEREFDKVDPLTKTYPELSTYQFASNTPIWAIDLDGLEAWKTTRNWTTDDVKAYSSSVKTQIDKYTADNVKFDCAQLAVSLLIGYAKDKGLPVKFTSVKGEVFTNESESFNGYNIKPGDVKGFEIAANEATTAYSILNDLVIVPERDKMRPGNLINVDGGHVEVVREKDKDEYVPSNKTPTVYGSNPAIELRKGKYINSTVDQKIWSVMSNPIPSTAPPVDSSLPGINGGGGPNSNDGNNGGPSFY